MVSGLEFDVLIVGGGLSGASLACALRGSRLRVGLVERAQPVRPAGWDARIYAISPANAQFLNECGVWEHLDFSRVQVVEHMDVKGDAGGHLDFRAYDCGIEALAWIVESSHIAVELWQTAKRQPNIEIVSPATPVSLRLDEGAARLRFDDGREVTSSLVVAADGVQSWVRDQVGITANIRPYGEVGVVANFECEIPHLGTAFQWFRPDGVLAYLPLPGNRMSIVWSTSEHEAANLLAMDSAKFCETVAQAGQTRLGALSLITPPTGFPLRLMRVDETVRPRLALIGDAAHAVHPLSGHGVNLGLQDARALSQELLAMPSFRDSGDVAVLQRYARRRAEETILVREVTDGLHRLFKPAITPLSWLRNAGMTMTGHIPGLRSVLARYAAGLL